MAFQIKDYTSIVASMINWMRSDQKRVTDFNVGSVVRTMLEAAAAELDELYQQMFIGLKEAIPVSVYHSFDFAALPAIPASGMVQVTIESSSTPVVVSAGTIFSPAAGGTTYSALQNVTISPGNTLVDVAVVATVPGLGGNIPASATFTLNPVPTGFVSAQNASPFINGAEAESEAARKSRFRAYVQSLARGTKAAIAYGLRTAFIADSQGNQIERVVHAEVIEPWVTDIQQPIGLVKCYVHNGIGNTSNSLVSRAREVVYGYYDENNRPVPGWKAAGVNVEVIAATETIVDVTGVLTPLTGYSSAELITQAKDLIRAYILGLNIGEESIKSEMIALAMAIPGVYNFTISDPEGDTNASSSQKLMPGTITIT